MSLKKLMSFTVKNYFLVGFLAIILFVGAVASYKLFFSHFQTYIYVKVKLGQGMWWSGGQKPSIWMVRGIKKGDKGKDLLGNPLIEVLTVNYYPFYGGDQFDVYLTLKLKVNGNSKKHTYTFDRSNIGIGSPISIELPSYQASGTIIDIAEKPFDEKTIEKTIELVKRNAYPWEYDAITVGDSYFDGEQKLFEIISKDFSNTYALQPDLFGNFTSQTSEVRRYIIVKAKILTKEKDGQLILGEDQVLRIGKTINISTPKFTFQDYVIGKIE